jgi:hypothetical protein
VIDTVLWVAATVTAPAGARALRPRIRTRLALWEDEVSFWARAAYGVLPLFGAWVTGAVAGFDCGITGIGLARWLSGAAICTALILAFAFSLRFPSIRRTVQVWFHPTRSWLVLFDEPRWAFYRGAGAVALVEPAAAQLAGLALGGLEWLARNGRPSRTSSRWVSGNRPSEVWSELVRLGVSAVLFALTRNLWLILATQAVAAALVLRSWPDSVSTR